MKIGSKEWQRFIVDGGRSLGIAIDESIAAAFSTLMEGTPKIKLMIKKQANTELLFAQAMKEGMSTLRQDGIMKVFKGLTDLAEVRRVCIN